MARRIIAAAAAFILLLAACIPEGPQTGKEVSNEEMAALIADELASESFSRDLSEAIEGRRGALTAVRTESCNGHIGYRLGFTGYGRLNLDGMVNLHLSGSGMGESMKPALYEMDGTLEAGGNPYQIDAFAGTASELEGGIRLSYPLIAGISADGAPAFTITPAPLPAGTEQEAVKAISEAFAASGSIPSEPETFISGDITAVLSGDGAEWSMEACSADISLTAASGSGLAVIRKDGRAWIAELQEILEGITIPPHISTLTLEMAYEGLQSLLQGNLLGAAAGLLNGRHSGVIALISSAVSDSGLKATFMLDGYPAADGNKAKGRLAIVFEGSGTGGSFVSEGYTMDAEELQIGNHTLTLSGISGNLIAPDGSRASLTICPDGAELSRGAVFGTPESGRLGCGSWEMEL